MWNRKEELTDVGQVVVSRTLSRDIWSEILREERIAFGAAKIEDSKEIEVPALNLSDSKVATTKSGADDPVGRKILIGLGSDKFNERVKAQGVLVAGLRQRTSGSFAAVKIGLLSEDPEIRERCLQAICAVFSLAGKAIKDASLIEEDNWPGRSVLFKWGPANPCQGYKGSDVDTNWLKLQQIREVANSFTQDKRVASEFADLDAATGGCLQDKCPTLALLFKDPALSQAKVKMDWCAAFYGPGYCTHPRKFQARDAFGYQLGALALSPSISKTDTFQEITRREMANIHNSGAYAEAAKRLLDLKRIGTPKQLGDQHNNKDDRAFENMKTALKSINPKVWLKIKQHLSTLESDAS